MKTLVDFYKYHNGKASDKWELYLHEYDRIFAPFKDSRISLLEIGVQNGGSLEIWAKYFSNAKKFVGCDINNKCGALKYDDARVAVVVGNATTPSAKKKILSHASSFDLIIDDGSHTSSDIIKTFANYFSKLNEGGLFIAEDIHCSFWESFEGGLYDPYSSISFFKRLADIVNYEHWKIKKKRIELLSGFSKKYRVKFMENELAKIHSVEFINSICVIRKAKREENLLGRRHVTGKEESVVFGNKKLNLKTYSSFNLPSQQANLWSNLTVAPDEQYQMMKVELEECINRINLIENSRSWRLTKPLRRVSAYIKTLVEKLTNGFK